MKYLNMNTKYQLVYDSYYLTIKLVYDLYSLTRKSQINTQYSHSLSKTGSRSCLKRNKFKWTGLWIIKESLWVESLSVIPEPIKTIFIKYYI